MQFRTPVTTDTSLRGLLDHTGSYLMLGSCFTDEMSRRLKRDGFSVTANPGGPLYNPLSILAWMQRLESGRPFTADELTAAPDGRMHSWMHHSSFSRTDPAEALAAMNLALAEAAEALRSCRALFVTLGSNRVFRLAGSGMIVSNCHKHHPATFTESRLTVAETAEALAGITAILARVNPAAATVWTVSPVRHPGQGGLHADNLSKATLLLAAESAGGTYFPAYEALKDDLRDYRFYAADMRHPSDTAADYIYTLLCDTFMTPDTLTRAATHRRAALRAAHRPGGRNA